MKVPPQRSTHDSRHNNPSTSKERWHWEKRNSSAVSAGDCSMLRVLPRQALDDERSSTSGPHWWWKHWYELVFITIRCGLSGTERLPTRWIISSISFWVMILSIFGTLFLKQSFYAFQPWPDLHTKRPIGSISLVMNSSDNSISCSKTSLYRRTLLPSSANEDVICSAFCRTTMLRTCNSTERLITLV